MKFRSRTPLAAALALAALVPAALSAHCDGLDGPVVKAAAKTLDTGNIAHVAIWVQAEQEPELRDALRAVLAVRALGPDARLLADRHFYETAVRLHRAGEGAPYTGLKPAGRDPGPAITAADRAVESGSPRDVMGVLHQSIEQGLAARLEELHRAKSGKDIRAGRQYVRAYVDFLHYVERLDASARAGETQPASPQPASGQHAHEH